jgi:hypothetical protein
MEPSHDAWQPLFESLDQFSEDFMGDREQPDQQPRDSTFEIADSSAAESQLTLDHLLAGITEQNLHPEVDTGPPVGQEAWLDTSIRS